MDEDEDYEFLDSEVVTYTPCARFKRSDAIVLGVMLCRRIADAVAETLALAEQLAAGHANFENNQAAFHEEAALAIETITTDGED